jgi:hypothetical protein
MHKGSEVVSPAGPNSVELTFLSGRPDADPGALWPDPTLRDWRRDGRFIERPIPVLELRRQVWFMDVEDMRVAIVLDSYPDTDPSLLLEALAVVESITIDPTVDGEGRLLVFELPDGWDSG